MLTISIVVLMILGYYSLRSADLYMFTDRFKYISYGLMSILCSLLIILALFAKVKYNL